MNFINITPDVINRAVELLQQHPLRTLDALHISCAVNATIDLFVTSDLKQGNAAKAIGLDVKYI